MPTNLCTATEYEIIFRFRATTMGIANGSNPWEGHTRIPEAVGNTASPPSGDEEDDAEFTYPGAVGDYSTQMEALFDGDEDSGLYGERHKSDDEDKEEEFFYDGIDADTSTSYKEQLRDVLGQDHEEEEVERSLVLENEYFSHEDDEPLVCCHVFKKFLPVVHTTFTEAFE